MKGFTAVLAGCSTVLLIAGVLIACVVSWLFGAATIVFLLLHGIIELRK